MIGSGRIANFGAWLSLVERLNGVQEVPSSNLGAPTILQYPERMRSAEFGMETSVGPQTRDQRPETSRLRQTVYGLRSTVSGPTCPAPRTPHPAPSQDFTD